MTSGSHHSSTTEASVKVQDPNIQVLACKYNRLVNEIIQVVKENKKHVLLPLHIDLNNLFALDVDDDIWQDIGLTKSDNTTEPPPWLCDEDICEGIKAMLEEDRCIEEQRQLAIEKQSLQDWFSEEWCIVNEAPKASGTRVFYSLLV